jgi:hypothetical protein
MINLIPNEEKKKKVKDFYFRLAVVFFMVLGFSMMIATVAIMPSYFLSLVKKNLVNTLLEGLESNPISSRDQETLNTINDLKNKLKIIEGTQKSEYSISKRVINEILVNKMPDIEINEISYESISPGGKLVSIKGVAPSRERLLLFRRALEDDVAFKKVNLPISNFIKGSNISFSLSLISS